MSAYKIINEDNEVINTIIASLEFCEKVYPNCRYEGSHSAELTEEQETERATQEARDWRDSELFSTDEAAKIPDWPNRANILVYRQDLRDWPSTQDFPDTKPTLGE